MSTFADAPMVFRSRYQPPAVVPPDRRGSFISRCIDIDPRPVSELVYCGKPVIQSKLVAEYEPDVVMMLKLDSRRDVPVVVQKGGVAMYEVAGRWLCNPKTYEWLLQAVRDRDSRKGGAP